MLKIDIKTIPNNEQRYKTVGDYYRNKHKQYIRISELGNKDYEFLVAIHELIEMYLCEKRGITEDSIDAFDMEFEKMRLPGNSDEPGDHEKAPYRKEHRFAENIERQIAHELGFNWQKYDDFISKL